eukprot:jgi/Ulvmu1/3115/UM015_0155.1
MLVRSSASSGRQIWRGVRAPIGRRNVMNTALPSKFELSDKTICITGASRGIGLEFAKQFIDKGNHVVAAVRDPDSSPGLKQLKASHAKQLTVITLDVADTASISSWASSMAEKFSSVDVLINNAGMLERCTLEDVSEDAMISSYKINCMGPLFTVQALLKQKLLPHGALIANVTSLVASITENEGGNQYAYRCSKIAANMATKSMSIDLQPKGITCTILHPGYVRTDMTGGSGLIDVDESVQGMIGVLESGVELNGQWYHTSGRHLPW